MKRKLLALLMVAVMVACAGCTTDKPTPKNEDGYENIVRVSSAKEFIEAIAPNTTIEVEAGYYNLTNYIEAIWEKHGKEWNKTHDYIRLEEIYGDVQLVVNSVEGLTIIGAEDEDEICEIVIESEMADVMKFVNCNDLTIKRLKIGHTEMVECGGNVITLEGCDNILLSKLDLYGCGVIGLEANNCTDLRMKSSIIHDCSWVAMSLQGRYGKFQFTDCTFDHNEWGFLLGEDEEVVNFKNCKFGQQESNGILYLPFVNLVNCDVMEPDIYPDFEDDGYDNFYDGDTYEDGPKG